MDKMAKNKPSRLSDREEVSQKVSYQSLAYNWTTKGPLERTRQLGYMYETTYRHTPWKID